MNIRVHERFLIIYNYDYLLSQDPLHAPWYAPWYENHWLWTDDLMLPAIAFGLLGITVATVHTICFVCHEQVSSEFSLAAGFPPHNPIHLQHADVPSSTMSKQQPPLTCGITKEVVLESSCSL